MSTPTYTEMLDNAKIALNNALLSPSPNYKIGEETVSYGDYIATLTNTIKNLESLIASSSSDLPFEEITYNTGA